MRPKDFALPITRFPHFAPGQERAICDLSQSFTRFDLEVAPTGSGKTVINWCAAKLKARQRFLYLVSTKALEDQILSSLGRDTLGGAGIIGIRGHRNYPCASRNTGDDSFECNNPRGCYYRERVTDCKLSSSVVTNYAHHINYIFAGDPLRLGAFDVLICDEAHNLRDIICDQVGFSITDMFLSDLRLGWPRGLREEDAVAFLESVRNKIDALKDPTYKQSRIGQKIALYLVDHESHKWVFEPLQAHNNHGPSIEFKPVWPLNYAEVYVFAGIPKVILSSATIHPEEMSRLGIPTSDLSVVNVPSTFPAERRPVVYYNVPPRIRLKSSSTPSQRKFIINRVDTLASYHSDVRGIVQCTSYDWARQIKAQSRCPHIYIDHKSSAGLNKAMRYYESMDASGQFLLSPSIKEGTDLPYDLCRVIIVPKVPFIDTRSPQQHYRQLEDKAYSNRETARIFEQMCGRGMRRVDDYCVVYVPDGQWSWFHAVKGVFSEHFQAAFRVSSNPINLKQFV